MNCFRLICVLSCVCFLASCDGKFPFPSKPKTVKGQVFIVTPASKTLKLSLVEIGLHSRETIDDWRNFYALTRHEKIEDLRTQIKAQRVELEKLLSSRDQKLRELEARKVRRPSLIRQYGEDEFRSYNRKLATQIVEIDRNIKTQIGEIEANESSLTNFNSYASGCENLPEASRTTRTDANGEFSLEVPADGNFTLTGYTTLGAGASTEDLCWIVDLSTEEQSDQYLLTNLNLLNDQWWDQ